MKVRSGSLVLVFGSVIATASLCIGCGGDSAGGSGGSGGSGGDGNGLTDAERACQLTDAATVTSIFEGTAS